MMQLRRTLSMKRYIIRFPPFFEGQKEIVDELCRAYGDPQLKLHSLKLIWAMKQGTLHEWLEQHSFNFREMPDPAGTNIMTIVGESLVREALPELACFSLSADPSIVLLACISSCAGPGFC